MKMQCCMSFYMMCAIFGHGLKGQSLNPFMYYKIMFWLSFVASVPFVISVYKYEQGVGCATSYLALWHDSAKIML